MHEIVQSYLETLKTTPDNTIWEDLTLKLALALEFSSRNIGDNDYLFYHSNLPESLLTQKMDIPTQRDVVQQLVYLIREVDHYQHPGLVWAISKAAPVVAVDAALTLMQKWPLDCDEVLTRQLILIFDDIDRDEDGHSLAEIVKLLRARYPIPFLKCILVRYNEPTTKRAVPTTDICEVAQRNIEKIEAYLR
ncbi:MAG TPA: hypothetical protein VHO69_06595 [Phototrophicaceae bacterium]|nr:hypothetical protein [Phototrophicaceae bacterium]